MHLKSIWKFDLIQYDGPEYESYIFMQCDAQERMLGFVQNKELAIETIQKVNSEAHEVLVSEQNSRVFGKTEASIWEGVKDKAVYCEKLSFSMVPEMKDMLEERLKDQ